MYEADSCRGLDGHNRSASQIKDVILRLEKTYDKPTSGVYFSVVHCKNDSFSDKYANNFASGLVPVVHTNKIKSNKSEVVEIKNEPWEDINKRDQIILNALRSKKMSPEDLLSLRANGGNASSGNSRHRYATPHRRTYGPCSHVKWFEIL